MLLSLDKIQKILFSANGRIDVLESEVKALELVSHGQSEAILALQKPKAKPKPKPKVTPKAKKRSRKK